MSISQNFPSTRPSLNLNFARSQKLDPRITFTRSSTATYTGGDGLIKTAATDTPRFDFNATTGDCLGLLIEESRSNIVLRSQELATSPWGTISGVVGGFTVTNNVTTSPDGTSNASQINSTSFTNGDSVYQDASAIGNGTYTLSVFVKGGTCNSIIFTGFFTGNSTQGFSFNYNPLTGTITGTGGGSNHTVVPYPNGWYRIYFTVTGTNVLNTTLRFQVYTNATGITYIWGAQLEAGAFPTSYIPTVASTVTRSADSASITGTNFSSFYNPSEGTVFVQAAPSTSAAYSGYLYAIGSDFNNSITAYRQSDYQPVVRIRSSSSDVYGALGFGAIWTTNTVRKVGLTFKTNSFNSAVSGTVSSDVTSGTLPSYSNLTIGSLSNASYLNGTISQLSYYPVRLSNSQLQSLTK